MTKELKHFFETKPANGTLYLLWMGQAGFLIKNSMGKVMGIDLYLSDLAEIQDGNKRLMMPLAEAAELDLDILLASHFHTDHLDLLSIPEFLKKGACIFCDADSFELCSKQGMDMTRFTSMKTGDVLEREGFRVEAVFADHGDAAKNALGFLITTEGKTVYFTGDTSWQEKRLAYAASKDIDILLVPINGEYGNMNERDAAMLAGAVKAKLTVPCHFWTFARHQGSPWQFVTEMEAYQKNCKYYVMAQGEMITYPC